MPVIVLGTVLAMIFYAVALLVTGEMIRGPYPNILGAGLFVCAAVLLVSVTRFIAISRRNKGGR